MTPLAVPALTRACCHLPGLMTRSEVRGEIASRDGAGESRPRPRQPAGRCGQPGRVTLTPGHLAGPHPALPRPPCLSSHALCPAVSGPELCRGRTELRPCSDPRTRPFQIVQTRATHSVRLSLGPTPGSLSDPTVRDAGPMMGLMAGRGRVVTASAPVRTCPVATGPRLSPMGLACTCCVLYRVLCTVMSRGTGRHSVSTTGTGHSLPLPGSLPDPV